eukprot:3711362-Pyramimonas_sp.AAC.1
MDLLPVLVCSLEREKLPRLLVRDDRVLLPPRVLGVGTNLGLPRRIRRSRRRRRRKRRRRMWKIRWSKTS